MPEMNRDEIAKLEALYASNPEGRVFTHLAEAYRKAGEYDRARAILEQGLTKHPGYASAYVVLGRVYLDLDNGPQATASFKRVLDLDPHNLVALRSLGDIARSAGRRDEALGYFEELRHQDPSNVEIETIVAELKHAPAEAPVDTPVEEPAEAPTASGDSAQPAFEELRAEEEATTSYKSTFEEFEAPGVEETEPQPEVAAEAEAGAELESFAGPDGLPGFESEEPDLGDLVAPDIELDWGASEPAQQALPGDLADFATFAATAETSAPAEPVEDEVPTFSFPDLDEQFEEPPEEPMVVFPHFEAEPEALLEPELEPFRDIQLEAVPEPEPEVPEPELDLLPEPEPESEPEFVREPELEPFAASAPESFSPSTPEPALLTETMANLYRDQGLYDRAADVYRGLLRDRPYDNSLLQKLEEVERLAGPEAPPPFQGFPEPEAEPEPEPFIATAPEAPAATPNDGLDATESEEVFESPWTSAASPSADPLTPYAWAETQAAEQEEGPPIAEYFQSLLSWRPTTKSNGATAHFQLEPEPEISSFEPAPEADEGAILDLQMPADTAQQPMFEEPVLPTEPAPEETEAATPLAQTPPAIPADELMPWEEPASPSMPAAPLTPVSPPVSSARPDENPVESAFDEWFNANPDTAPSPVQPTPGAPAPSTPASGESDGDDDDDLEMFRSWLQSLKK